MITLAATNTIGGVAGSASVITYSIFGMTLNAGAETYAVLAQGQLSNSAATIYTVPSATTAFVKQIMLVNTSGSSVSGVILYINGTTAPFQITGSMSVPANGTVMIDDDGLAIYDANGSLLTSQLSVAATSLSAASALPAGTTATTQAALDSSTKVATTAYTDSAVSAYSAQSTNINQVTVNFGTQPLKSGSFTISGTGLTLGQPVFVAQASTRTGQTLTDSIEMDSIRATGVVKNATTIYVNWHCNTFVSNSYTFNYWFAGSSAPVTTPYIAVTANFVASQYNQTIDCTANTFTVTLPNAIGISGKVMNVKNTGTGVITIATTASQTIDGQTTQTLSAQYTSLELISTGANWIIV